MSDDYFTVPNGTAGLITKADLDRIQATQDQYDTIGARRELWIKIEDLANGEGPVRTMMVSKYTPPKLSPNGKSDLGPPGSIDRSEVPGE